MLEFDKIRVAGASYAITGAGKELFLSLTPQKTLSSIAKDLTRLRRMMDLLDRGETVPLEGLCDIRDLIKKLDSISSFLEGGELLELARFLEAVEKLRKFLHRHRETAPELFETFKPLIPLPEIVKLIRSRIDDEGEVRDDASHALKKLNSELETAQRKIQAELNRMVKSLSQQKLLQEEFHTLRGDRYVIPVRAASKGKVPGIVHDVSGTGETFFIEPLIIVEQSNHLATVKIAIRNEIQRILLEISDTIRPNLTELRQNSSLIAEFDFLHAKARFAHNNLFSIPEMAERGCLKLLRAHHPLLYLKDKKASVPISLELSDEDKVLVISGPNAGGKTTALKTIGLLSLMAQSGLAVPVFPDSRFPLYHNWFADIGDAQDVTEGVSTFSAHIRNISRILRETDGKSLVLLDELGTATDPTEGGTLAIGILEKLARSSALIIATSHLSPLKAWAHEFKGARNASFRLDEVTREPTFQIMLNVPGASEAFLIAEREGLPVDVMRRAAQLLPKGEADLSQLIASLQIKEKELERNRKEIKDLLVEQKKLRYHVGELQEYLKEKERRLEEDMLSAKEGLLKEAGQFIEKQLADLPTRQAIVQAKNEIKKEIQKVEEKQKDLKQIYEEPVDPDRFPPGQVVYISPLNDFGKIKAADCVKLTVIVTVKGMDVTVPMSGLKIPLPQEIPTSRAQKITWKKRDDVPFELDLHGMYVEEMLSVVEKYLSDAVLADMPYVKILHGIGTGALRKALHEYLQKHPLVKKYGYGTAEEGGGGVTIVNF